MKLIMIWNNVISFLIRSDLLGEALVVFHSIPVSKHCITRQ